MEHAPRPKNVRQRWPEVLWKLAKWIHGSLPSVASALRCACGRRCTWRNPAHASRVCHRHRGVACFAVRRCNPPHSARHPTQSLLPRESNLVGRRPHNRNRVPKGLCWSQQSRKTGIANMICCGSKQAMSEHVTAKDPQTARNSKPTPHSSGLGSGFKLQQLRTRQNVPHPSNKKL